MITEEKIEIVTEVGYSPLDPANFKGLNPYAEFSCQAFKKCCKKYKKGKRCSKCPNR